MLETILNHLHNWFPIRGAARAGTFEIVSGAFANVDFLKDGQYFRVKGSVFSDGLHQYPAFNLADETFDGEIWPLAIPVQVIELAEEIEQWRDKNPETGKISESFENYSYTRASSGGEVVGWQRVFASRLNHWRKPA